VKLFLFLMQYGKYLFQDLPKQRRFRVHLRTIYLAETKNFLLKVLLVKLKTS